MTDNVAFDEASQFVIAIDGPGGSGKSTAAVLVAEKTGLPYLNTGSMYRAITFGVLGRGVDPEDWSGIDEVLPQIDLDLSAHAIIVDGVDATEAIRGPEVTGAVSSVSANPTVRASMVKLQQSWVEKSGGGVLEGRDIGTVVVPLARLKIFMTATTAERARRRAIETGQDVDEVEADLIRRDKADSERERSPLRAADDAVAFDTTGIDIDSVVEAIISMAQARKMLDRGAAGGRS